jgi:hypothetical protein
MQMFDANFSQKCFKKCFAPHDQNPSYGPRQFCSHPFFSNSIPSAKRTPQYSEIADGVFVFVLYVTIISNNPTVIDKTKSHNLIKNEK